MTIQFYVKNVYGRELQYIADEKMARIVSGLTGKKTLEDDHKNLLSELGYTFQQVIPPTK